MSILRPFAGTASAVTAPARTRLAADAVVLVAFPALVAFGINNGVHLYHRYIEEGRGSMRFVLRRTGETTAVATLVGMAGFTGLAFSAHRGLETLGATALIGLSMSLLAPLLIMPLIIGYLEERALETDEQDPARNRPKEVSA